MWAARCGGGPRGRRRHGVAFGPLGWAGRFFGPGEVRLALLSLISEEPRHGYDLMRELARRSRGVYRASAGTVYPTLQQLEDEGLAVVETAEGRKIYRITDRGRAELDASEVAVRRIWRRAEGWGEWSWTLDPDAVEVARPAMRLVKLALRSAGRSPSLERIERIEEILRRAEREIRDLDDERPPKREGRRR